MTTIPKLTIIYNQIIADLQTEFTITIPVFGKAFLRAFAAVMAAKIYVLYLFGGDIQRNALPDLADDANKGGTLERWGMIKLKRLPLPATAAYYNVTVNGTVGATIDALTTFLSDDDSKNPGKLFILDTAFTLVTGTDTINIRALAAGTGSDLDIGDTLTATTPLILVDAGVTVTAETISAVDAETREEYRTKVLLAYKSEPQGGAAIDYRIWGLDAAGIRQIYPYTRTGFSNEVIVYVEATVSSSSDGRGTPTAPQLTQVGEVIEINPDTSLPPQERKRRPLGVFNVEVEPITVKVIDIVINGYESYTSDAAALIRAQLDESITNKMRPFIPSCDYISDKDNILNVPKISYLIQLAVPGSVFTYVELYVDSVLTTSITFINGNIPYLDTVTYA